MFFDTCNQELGQFVPDVTALALKQVLSEHNSAAVVF